MKEGVIKNKTRFPLELKSIYAHTNTRRLYIEQMLITHFHSPISDRSVNE